MGCYELLLLEQKSNLNDTFKFESTYNFLKKYYRRRYSRLELNVMIFLLNIYTMNSCIRLIFKVMLIL